MRHGPWLLSASTYRNAGQTCVCANRLCVQDAVYDTFVQKSAAKVKLLKVGNGFEPGVGQSPLIEDAATNEDVVTGYCKGGQELLLFVWHIAPVNRRFWPGIVYAQARRLTPMHGAPCAVMGGTHAVSWR